MKEKLASYDSELNNIKLVVDKLVTKQNSSVFDKICKMCSELFDKVCDYDPKDLSLEDIKGLINVLNRLLELCQKLKNYKEYLIGVVSQNITELKGMSETPKENALESDRVVEEVEEVKTDEVESSVTLRLSNEKEKNAA